MQKGSAVYIMTNKNYTVLYTGVTADLLRRVYQYRDRLDEKCFTYKYNIYNLVYFESFHSIEEAIAWEKQIKGGSRKKKEDLINSVNPKWMDLWKDIQGWSFKKKTLSGYCFFARRFLVKIKPTEALLAMT